jgi:UDP-2-acetamido-3-amino-2,3-dideoxy-glucuronate N-acetyltransferase
LDPLQQPQSSAENTALPASGVSQNVQALIESPTPDGSSVSGFFRHPQALVESRNIGARTRIWAFAHVLPHAAIGADCNICDNTFIENDVVIGDRVTVKCGVQLWDGLRIEDDVFIGPNATFSNDRFPRSKRHLSQYPVTTIRRGASIGANATILPGLTINQYAMVGAGAVVTRSVPPYAVVVGNPARIARYASESTANGHPATNAPMPSPEMHQTIGSAGVRLLRVPTIKDLRGNLVAREVGKGLPFAPQRYFVVLGVPTKEVRGEHAHRQCEQLLVCLQGSLSVVVDDSKDRQEFVLDSPEISLYLPPMVWGIQYKYTPDAVLLVLASHPYDPHDYIRDYDVFLKERGSMPNESLGSHS